MDLIVNYWPQLLTFIAIVVAFTTMKVNIDILKDKVKTLFNLINKDKD
jgi:divalent metal cation (Fe/Co/Zn/Cd) transporter